MNVNEKIVDWIVKRAKSDYSEDIALILLYGSFVNGTANPKSDVDCYFIPKTECGYRFAADFIIDGIGYDIFPRRAQRLMIASAVVSIFALLSQKVTKARLVRTMKNNLFRLSPNTLIQY